MPELFMFLSETQRKYLVHDHIIGSAIFNVLFNSLLAWLTFRHQPFVPMKGDPSIVGDTIGTALILPVLTCLIITPLVRRRLRSGKVEPLAAIPHDYRMVLWLPSWSFFRGLVVGIACLAWFAPVLLGLLLLAGVESLPLGAFIIVKATYAGVMAACVSPIFAMHTLATSDPALSEERALAGG
jgi:hypothetical protein